MKEASDTIYEITKLVKKNPQNVMENSNKLKNSYNMKLLNHPQAFVYCVLRDGQFGHQPFIAS